MDKVKRKHQFQIRKVPLKRFIPEKTPQLYALDVHSICLPSRNRNIINWASVNCDVDHNYEEEFNDQIIYSQAYQQLYSSYANIKEERARERAFLQAEIDQADLLVSKEQDEKNRLMGIRDGLYVQIEGLRDRLAEARDKNYNLRWEVYHQRGAHYANVNGYNNQLTYEQLLQMEQQIGNVSKGLPEEQIERLEKKAYECQSSCSRQICCICYDEISEGEMVTVLQCRHTHHCECIRDWLLKQKICPICKQQVGFVENESSPL